MFFNHSLTRISQIVKLEFQSLSISKVRLALPRSTGLSFRSQVFEAKYFRDSNFMAASLSSQVLGDLAGTYFSSSISCHGCLKTGGNEADTTIWGDLWLIDD